MPPAPTFLGLDFAAGSRIAAVYTMLLAILMCGAAGWHLSRYEDDWHEQFIFQMGISYIIGGLLLIAGSICLLIAISKQNHRLLWPWFIAFSLITGYYTFRYCYQGFYLKILTIEECVIGMILLLIGILLYIVVYFYRKELFSAMYDQQIQGQPVIIMQQQYTPITTADSKYYPPPYSEQQPYYQPGTQQPYYPPGTQQPYYPPGYQPPQPAT